MKAYVMTIAGAALLSAFADAAAPHGWHKYIRLVTGLILLSVIVAPVLKADQIYTGDYPPVEQVDYTPLPRLVASQLEQNICEDIKSRLKSEMDAEVDDVCVSVRINSDGLIDGVDEIYVHTAHSDFDAIKARLAEVYGAKKIEVLR